MKLVKALTSRAVITFLLIMVQLGWVFFFWVKLSSYSQIIGILFELLSVFIVLVIVTKDDNPSFKIIWIIIITTIPLFGGLLYVFFGSKHTIKKVSDKISVQQEKYLEYKTPNAEVLKKVCESDRRIGGSVSYLQNTCKFPAWENTQSTYYKVGEDMYADMLVALEQAEHFIFMEYFIIEHGYMWDGIYQILKRKVASGVDVRLIYDDMGSLELLPRDFAKSLTQEGIKCFAFNRFVPFLSVIMNNRDHRKILVVDGHTAFNGGINIADEYINKKHKLGHWKDTGVKLEGKAVWNFTVMFLEMWNAFCPTDEDIKQFSVESHIKQMPESDGVVIPFGDSPLDKEAMGQHIYIDILSQAKDYVYIFTPYLIIDDEMQNALKLAAKRGVDVRLMTPGIPDKQVIYRTSRSYYSILLDSGVRIYEYTPGFLHAKSYVCDDEVAVVGTINMDFRSLYLHFECGTYLYKTQSVMKIKEDYLETMAKAREVKKHGEDKFSIIDAVIRVLAPML